ncbi:MAG: Dabb family protein [Planctomycetes bacterium]|nr:Dabb family protein [Planctomycetota bacterium]
MMKWLAVTLAVTALACALGCSRGDISSEGRILQMVKYHPRQNATEEAIQELEDAIPDIPSKAPTMERFEWARVIDERDHPHVTHCLLVLFNEPRSLFDDAYRRALDEAGGRDDYGRPCFNLGEETFLLHDATPHVRTNTDGRLRRSVLVVLKSETPREEMQKLEDAIAALPEKIPAIEKLEWGVRMSYDPTKPKPIDPAYRSGTYRLFFTFDSTRARDACLADPAYQEFQSALEQHVGHQSEGEFVAHVEYIARAD